MKRNEDNKLYRQTRNESGFTLTRNENGSTLTRNESGFTLIEVLIVAFILALAGAVILPSLITANNRSDLERVAEMMIAEFSLAQQTAVATGIVCRVYFYKNVEAFRVFLPETGRTVWLPEGIRIHSNNFPDTDGGVYRLLSFNRNGAPNQAGTIGLRDKQGNKLYIIVNIATGRMRISETPPATKAINPSDSNPFFYT